MAGKGPGFQVTGNIGDKQKGLKINLQSLHLAKLPGSLVLSVPVEHIPEVKQSTRILASIPFLHFFRNHLSKFFLLRIIQIALEAE
jgi:hypothetical protein